MIVERSGSRHTGDTGTGGIPRRAGLFSPPYSIAPTTVDPPLLGAVMGGYRRRSGRAEDIIEVVGATFLGLETHEVDGGSAHPGSVPSNSAVGCRSDSPSRRTGRR